MTDHVVMQRLSIDGAKKLSLSRLGYVDEDILIRATTPVDVMKCSCGEQFESKKDAKHHLQSMSETR